MDTFHPSPIKGVHANLYISWGGGAKRLDIDDKIIHFLQFPHKSNRAGFQFYKTETTQKQILSQSTRPTHSTV